MEGISIFYTTPEDSQAFVVNSYGTRGEYMTEFEVMTMTQIGSHIMSKEIKDYYLSYCLPHKDCSVEIYAKINDRYFWTFYV